MPSFQTVVYPNALVNRLSFVSIEAAFNGLVFAGIKSLTYSDELTPTDVYGTAPEKIGRTRGKANAAGSFVMYAEEFENLRLALGGGVGYMEIPFLITITKFEIGMNPLVELLESCRITKAENSDSEGTEALSVNVTLNIFRVTRTGGDRSTLPFPTL
jgi:hypothetical protein